MPRRSKETNKMRFPYLANTKYKDKKYFGYYDPRHRLREEDINDLEADGVNWLLMTAVNIELADGKRMGMSSEDVEKKIKRQWKFCENWVKAQTILGDQLRSDVDHL